MKCVRSVTFSADGKWLAAGGDAQDALSKDEQTMVTIWDAGSGAVTASLKGGTTQMMHVLFSPDGQTLAGGARNVLLWDLSGLKRDRKSVV